MKSHVDHRGADRRLDLLLRGGEVVRYHAEGYGVDKQAVSDHSWRVVVVLLHLWPRASHKLVLAALYHDVAECHTGDLPAPLARISPSIDKEFKRLEKEFHRELDVPWSGDLTQDDHCRLKCADYLELYVTCLRQHSANAQRIAGRGRERVMEWAETLSARDKVRIQRLLDDVAQPDLL